MRHGTCYGTRYQGEIEALSGVDQADIQMVFDPPWDASKMTEEARLEAGLF